MIFASRRSREGPDPHLEMKVILFFVGAVLALAGIKLDSSLLVGLAIVILMGGVALRLIPEKEPPAEDSPTDQDGGQREPPE